MRKKIAIFFVLCFIPILVLTRYSTKKLNQKIEENAARQITIIEEAVSERFDTFFRTSRLIAVIAAKQFSKAADRFDEIYIKLGKIATENFNEVTALNLVNLRGEIIRVYPESDNKSALRKTSQNYQSLLKFAEKKSPYWLSAPFDLYQGWEGVSIYVPYYQNDTPAGWVALVVSTNRFIENFGLEKLFESYHLVISDKETGKNYFSTHPLPETKEHVHSANFQTLNRELIYYLWPRENSMYRNIQWYQCFILALLLTGLLTILYYLYLQKQGTKRELNKINTLLKLTSEEASATLMEIFDELNLMGKGTGYVSTDRMVKYVHYITTLLEQISLAEKFFDHLSNQEFSFNNIHPLLSEQLDMLKNKMDEKNLKVEFDATPPSNDFPVWSNKWLLCHSVLGNVLRVIQYISKNGSKIKVTFFEDKTYYYLSFNVENIDNNVDELHSEIMDRSLLIAHKVIKLSKGKIEVFDQPVGSKTIALKFSKE